MCMPTKTKPEEGMPNLRQTDDSSTNIVYEYEDGAKVLLSIEQHQDMEMRCRHMCRIARNSKPFTEAELAYWSHYSEPPVFAGMIFTDEPTQKEIVEWQEAYAWIKKFDCEAFKKKYGVQFIYDDYSEPPYQDPMHYDFDNTKAKSWGIGPNDLSLRVDKCV